MADPTQAVSPQFVGRYPGAPMPLNTTPVTIPSPPVFAPGQFVPKFATGAPGTTSGAVPTLQTGILPTLDTAALNRAVVAPPAGPAPGVVTPANAASIPPVTPAPAPTDRARALVASLPTYNAAAPAQAAQPPIYDANGNEQVNLPPLPPELAAGGGGAVGLPGESGPDTNAASPVGAQADDGAWRPATTQAGSTWSLAGKPVPYGSNTAAGITGGSLIDPGSAIQRGYDQQQAYQASALQALMSIAQQGGSPLNASFRFAHLAPAFAAAVGNNNFGGVQGQGVDTLNNAIAGVSSTGISADANVQAEQLRAAEVRRATEAGKEVGVVGTELNVPGNPLFGVHDVHGVIMRDAQGRATGASVPFKGVGGAVQSPEGAAVTPTLSQYLSANKALNPGMSDEEITQRYNARFRKGQ